MTKFKNIILFSLMMALLQSCASTGLKSDKNKKKDKIDYENPGELIDTTQVRIEGQKTLDKKIEDGPKPYGGDFSPTEAERRITIAKEKIKSYVSISDDVISLYSPGTAFCTTTIGSIFNPVERTETLFVILSRDIGSFSPFLFVTVMEDAFEPTCSLSFLV